MKKFHLAAVALAIASAALAQLSKYKDWAKSPEAYFLTAAERQEWSKTANDADAEKFIAAYWAKRGGDKFREAVQRRIAAADEQFKMRRQKGSESARGRIFVVLGAPSRVTEARSPAADAEASGADAGRSGTGIGALQEEQGRGSVIQTWIYQKDKFDPSWGVGELQARINVDPQQGSDQLVNAGPVNKAIEKVAERSIAASPATAATGVAPSVPSAASGPSTSAAPPAAPPPPAPPTAAIPAAARSALEAAAKTTPEKEAAGFVGGVFQTRSGEPFYAFQIVAPAKKDRPLPATMKLAALVTASDGKEAASIWEDAAGTPLKGSEGTDRASDRSIVLPPGTYHGSFGLFDPNNDAPLASAAQDFTIPDKGTEFRVSPLILSSAVAPLGKAPGPTDAFVFGGARVEPNGNRIFSREDSLWYFFTVSNPAATAELAASGAPPSGTPAAPPASTTPAVATTPAAGAPPSAPAAAATPAAPAKPRVMTRIGVSPGFEPQTRPAELQQIGANYWGGGSEIPLATFKPGYYMFTLNVRDLNAPKDSAASKGVDRSAEFVVLNPDGSLPPRANPTPAAKPTPRPRKKS